MKVSMIQCHLFNIDILTTFSLTTMVGPKMKILCIIEDDINVSYRISNMRHQFVIYDSNDPRG